VKKILLLLCLVSLTAACTPIAGMDPLSWEFGKYIAEKGAMVFLFIFALKNVPFFADFFVVWPKLAVVVNAASSFFLSIVACLGAGMHDEKFYMCMVVALGTFLAAAGLHGIVAKLSPDTSTPAVNPERVAKLKKD
jgi:hypothetical protein